MTMRCQVLLLSVLVTVGCEKKAGDHGHAHNASGGHDADPVVPTPAATVTHEHHDSPARYGCPMDADIRSDKPGRCSTCGMDLVELHAAAARSYDVVVSATPTATLGTPTTLNLEVRDDTGKRVTDFEVVHEQRLHLLMTSADLSWFAHEHPTIATDGSMSLAMTFPVAGSIRLYSDFRPRGAGGHVVQKPLQVGGKAAAKVALVADDLNKAKTVAGHLVKLQASSLVAGDRVQLDFTLVKDGKPVTDLKPYLGALGHCVIISEDGSQFLHSHPDDHDGDHDHAKGTDAHAHPPTPGQVSFATQFPTPGRYKMWGQFLHGDQMVIADFVVNVTSR
jgi:Heavy metal binding domain